MIELGRACVHVEHRNFNLLHLLWRGIARYACERNARFLIGCNSLTSQDPMEGVAMYELLRGKHLARPRWRTVPHPALALPAVCGGGDAGSSPHGTICSAGRPRARSRKSWQSFYSLGGSTGSPPAPNGFIVGAALPVACSAFA